MQNNASTTPKFKPEKKKGKVTTMAKSARLTPGREGYKILFNENTVIMNYKFAAAAAVHGSREYNLIRDIRKDFPSMKEVTVSGREQHTTKNNQRLTYKHMEKYIQVYENSDELLAVYETVKAASAPLASPYKYVCDWFKAQFPDYQKTLKFTDGHLRVAPVTPPDKKEYKTKLEMVSSKQDSKQKNANQEEAS